MRRGERYPAKNGLAFRPAPMLTLPRNDKLCATVPSTPALGVTRHFVLRESTGPRIFLSVIPF
jgi:hypothetical protein